MIAMVPRHDVQKFCHLVRQPIPGRWLSADAIGIFRIEFAATEEDIILLALSFSEQDVQLYEEIPSLVEHGEKYVQTFKP